MQVKLDLFIDHKLCLPSSFPHIPATALILDIHASVVLKFAAVEQKWVSKKKPLESSRVTFPREKKDKSPTEPIM